MSASPLPLNPDPLARALPDSLASYAFRSLLALSPLSALALANELPGPALPILLPLRPGVRPFCRPMLDFYLAKLSEPSTDWLAIVKKQNLPSKYCSTRSMRVAIRSTGVCDGAADEFASFTF